MSLTLEQNGVADDSEQLERLGISEEKNCPILHVYFNDDLTVM